MGDYPQYASNKVCGEGPIPAEIMLIGERPGKDEPRQGRPFVGLAGQEMDRYLAAGGLKRGDIYITNLVKDYRDGEKPSKEEIERDAEELRIEVECVNPRIIGLLGAYAIHEYGGIQEHVEDIHGVPRVGVQGRTFLPMYHPAAGFYDAETQPTILDDFHQLGRLARGEIGPREDKGECIYFEYGGEVVAQGNQFRDANYLGVDTEGSRKRPWCLTFSDQSHFGGLVRKSETMEAFKRTLAGYKGRVLLHNSMHDLSVLRGLGVEIREDGFIDTMVLAYLLCLEPQGLKPLAYRHLGMKMKSYLDVIGDTQQEKSLEYLIGVAACEWPPAEPYVLIENGEAKVKKPHGLNQRVKRILSDYEKKPETNLRDRWEKIEEHLRLPAEVECGELPEATLDDIPEAEAIAYACRDADATYRLGPILIDKIDSMGLGEVALIDHAIIPMVERMQSNGMRIDPEHFDRLADKCWNIMVEKKEAIKALTGAEINPDSGDQTAALIFDQLHLDRKVTTHELHLTKSKERLSTNDKTLEALRKVHPVVGLVADYREVSKIRNSFALKMPRFRDSEGRVHCNIRITRVSSGRLSATRPNLLAIPVRTELGQEVRAGFVPADGNILGTWDLDQVEMRYMADESRDPLLCGLFNDNTRDVHSETAALIFGLETYNVRDKKERYRNVQTMRHRYPAKRVGFGVITGITGHGLVDQMYLADTGREWTEDDCDRLIGEWFKIYPGVRAYMDSCRDEARRYGFVRDRWGRIRYLPGAHSPISRIREEALRQSHSHKIQAGAQGIMKRAMAVIWQYMNQWWWPEGWQVEPLLQVHDELLLEMPDKKEIKETVDTAMVAALTETTTLSVPLGAKGATGYSWGALEK